LLGPSRRPDNSFSLRYFFFFRKAILQFPLLRFFFFIFLFPFSIAAAGVKFFSFFLSPSHPSFRPFSYSSIHFLDPFLRCAGSIERLKILKPVIDRSPVWFPLPPVNLTFSPLFFRPYPPFLPPSEVTFDEYYATFRRGYR